MRVHEDRSLLHGRTFDTQVRNDETVVKKYVMGAVVSAENTQLIDDCLRKYSAFWSRIIPEMKCAGGASRQALRDEGL
jgi:hypothetical protein